VDFSSTPTSTQGVKLTKTHSNLKLGGGVQSTAFPLMFGNGEFDEKLDFANFADTQE
jgi:hypothetical protein